MVFNTRQGSGTHYKAVDGIRPRPTVSV